MLDQFACEPPEPPTTLTRVPAANSEAVKKICSQIAPGIEPAIVPIVPGGHCRPSECFKNVREKVILEGGFIKYGWTLWEWPRVFIEAEHHAVYEPPGGLPLIDVTPSLLAGIRMCLFLPDDAATYNFENEGFRRDNVRVALTDDKEIEDFFNIAKKYNDIMNSIPGVGKVHVTEEIARKLQTLNSERAKIQFELAMRYTSQGARCFCGSGEKFKRCHGQIGSRRK